MRHGLFVFLILVYSRLLLADECLKHLRYLASCQKDFVYCSTSNAVPVQLCMACEQNHKHMIEAYDVLSKAENCSEKYFDKDRINIVSTTQSILTGLWNKAYCDDCLNNDAYLIFNTKLTDLEKCYTRHVDQECIACLADYKDLNSFYNNLDVHNNGKVCYDMQDSMNRTRSFWSKEKKCCRRQFNMLLFILASAFVAFLPVLFYGSTYVIAKRRERNHGIMNEDEEFSSPSPGIAPTVAAASSTNLLDNSSHINTAPTRKVNQSAGDDSSDEELEPLKKP